MVRWQGMVRWQLEDWQLLACHPVLHLSTQSPVCVICRWVPTTSALGPGCAWATFKAQETIGMIRWQFDLEDWHSYICPLKGVGMAAVVA